MAVEVNTNWTQSVTGIVVRDNKVLLARHTYGGGTGMLIVPGGYLKNGELPQEAVAREVLEETGIVVEVKDMIAIRFSRKDWYAAFRADYVSGEARSDGDENSEVIWMDCEEAMTRDDVPGLTKELIRARMHGDALKLTSFPSRHSYESSFYTLHGNEE